MFLCSVPSLPGWRTELFAVHTGTLSSLSSVTSSATSRRPNPRLVLKTRKSDLARPQLLLLWWASFDAGAMLPLLSNHGTTTLHC